MNLLSHISPVWIISMLFLLPLSSFAQGVSINNSGKKAHPSAMIDISSSKKGLLTPRMSTQERLAISQPADGLLVYDTDTDGFWYYSNPVTTTDTAGISTTSGGWMALIPGNHDDAISDSDKDTGIQTEESPDDDIIRFDIADKEKMALMSNGHGVGRLEFYSNGNLSLGNDAGALLNTSSSGNISIGDRAGFSMTDETDNILIGTDAGYYLSKDDNVYIGHKSGYLATGEKNVALGNHAGENDNGSEQVMIGNEAGINSLSSRPGAVMIGYKAGENSTGSAPILIGKRAGISSSLQGTVVIGESAAYGISGNGVYIGKDVGRRAGDNNVLIGDDAGRAATGAIVNNNIGIGNRAGNSLALTSVKNVFIGNAAMEDASGSYNVILGNEAFNNNFGDHNVGVGYQTGAYSFHSDYSVTIGSYAGRDNGGDYNTFTGTRSGYNNSSGRSNAFFGAYSGYHNTTGIYNAFIGYYGGYIHKLGSYNSSLGLFAGSNSSTATYNNSTAIGSYSRYTASNQVRIGRSSTYSIGGYQAWTNLSDGRFKQDIQEDVPGLDFVMQLRPITYKVDIEGLDRFIEGTGSIEDPELAKEYDKELAAMRESSTAGKIVHSGFVAQEVEETAKQLGYAFSGVDRPQNEQDHYGLRYATFVVPLVKAVQEQQTLIQLQQEKMTKLEKELEELKKLIK